MTENLQMKQAFNFSNHNSNAVVVIFDLIQSILAQLQDDGSTAQLEKVMMILAELLVNQ